MCSSHGHKSQILSCNSYFVVLPWPPKMMSVKQSSGFVYPSWSRVAVRIYLKQQFSNIVLLHWNIFMFVSNNSHDWTRCSECHFSCILTWIFPQHILTHTNHLTIPHTLYIIYNLKTMNEASSVTTSWSY